MTSLEEIKSLIDSSHNIGLTYHVSPDGDAIGSILALKFALQTLGKKVKIFSKDNLKTNTILKFLPTINEVDGENYKLGSEIDLLIILDCGNIERVSCDYKSSNVNTLCIDHHVSNSKYCKYNFIRFDSSSTGEIVYDLIKFLGVKINRKIAISIYTAIMTDTDGLRFQSTTPKTFNVVGEIASTGLDFWNVYERLFLSTSYSKIKLLGLVFNALNIVNNKICVIKITDDMLKNTNSSDEHTNDIVSTGLTIENVQVSILMKDFQDKVKVSLRSKGEINVCEVAQKFGGGGHLRAAAFVTDMKMDKIEVSLLNEFRNLL